MYNKILTKINFIIILISFFFILSTFSLAESYIDTFDGTYSYSDVQGITFDTSNGGRSYVTTISIAELNPDPSNVLLMHFNGDVNDYSINPNHGIIVGTTDCTVDSVNDNYGQACMFDGYSDGNSDYVEILDSSKIYRTTETQEITVAFWAQSLGPTYASTLNMRPFMQLNGYCANSDNYNCLNIFYGHAWQDALAIAVNGGGFKNLIDPAPVENVWAHYVFTFNGITKNATVYVDGEFAGYTRLSTSNGIAFDSVDFVSRIGIASGYNFNGIMDEVAIYDRVFSAEEVSTLYSENRYQGGFVSELITANENEAIYGINMTIDGNAEIYISTQDNHWCKITDSLDYNSDCGFPTESFKYRAIFLDNTQEELRSIQFDFDMNTPTCPDSDSDGYDDCTIGYYGDDGKIQDCRIDDERIFPENSNLYCDCNFETVPRMSELCDDGVDNDCDGLVDCDDPLCSGKNGCAEKKCYSIELCSNGLDDDCDLVTDESECQVINDYLDDWRNSGEGIDWMVFGSYELFQDTIETHNVQFEGASLEESYIRITGPNALVSWDYSVPEDGYYVLMISDAGREEDVELRINNNGNNIELPPFQSSSAVNILSHSVGPGSMQLFYLVELNEGDVTIELDYAATHYAIYIRGSALMKLDNKKVNLNSEHPRLYFDDTLMSEIIAKKDSGELNSEYSSLFDSYYNSAQGQMEVSPTTFAEGWNGILSTLAYSGRINDMDSHTQKALELMSAKLDWLNSIDGAVGGSILSYPYMLKDISVAYDVAFNDMTFEEKETITNMLIIEMKRQALANIAGQWWRYPNRGGWTSSHSQGFISGLVLDDHHPMSEMNVEMGILMAKTTLRDNVYADGSYLQALSGYYGWDYHRTLIPFISALSNNEKYNYVNPYEYNNQALKRYDYYMIYSFHPNKKCFGPYGTSWCDSNLLYPSIGSSLMAVANYYNDGYIKWLYNNAFGDNRNSYLMFGDMPLFEIMIWDNDIDELNPESNPDLFPLGKVMRGHDHVFMRTGWDDTDTSFIARCGLGGNHNQREHGEFTMDADGIMYVAKYSDFESDLAFEENRYKNFITIDGLGQSPSPTMDGRFGEIPSFIHSDSLDYTLMDNSYAYNFGSTDDSTMPVDYSNRNVIFIRPTDSNTAGYFVMFDEIDASDELNHEYTYQLRSGYDLPYRQYCGECSDISVSVNQMSDNTFDLIPPNDDTKRMTVEFIEPKSYDFSTWDITTSVNTYGTALDLTRTANSETGEFITIFYPENDVENRYKPDSVIISNLPDGQHGFTLANDLFIWSRDNSQIDSNNIVSDAEFVAVRNNDFISMFNGKSLSYNGNTYATTNADTNIIIEFQQNGYVATIGNEALLTTVNIDYDFGGLNPSSTYTLYIDDSYVKSIQTDINGNVDETIILDSGKHKINIGSDYNPADSDQNGVIDLGELTSYIQSWRSSTTVSLAQLIESIRIWKGA